MVQLDLSAVQHACRKPNCNTGSGRFHRHHMGCEHLFVKHLSRLAGTRTYDRFKARYEAFDSRDIVLICDAHHAEIHFLYGDLIRRHRYRIGKPFCHWTWRQARILIRDLRKYCEDWLKKETKGSNWDWWQAELRRHNQELGLEPYDADLLSP